MHSEPDGGGQGSPTQESPHMTHHDIIVSDGAQVVCWIKLSGQGDEGVPGPYFPRTLQRRPKGSI